MLSVIDLGPVVQNSISLTLSLRPQFVNYISTSKANTVLFFVEKNVRTLCIIACKGLSHFFQQNEKDSNMFSTKNNCIFVILPFEILMIPLLKLTTLLILSNWPQY